MTTNDKTPHSPRCKVCGNLGTWGAPHYCPGPGGLTGTWVEDHGEIHHAPRRYAVRFAFEGETTFETLDDAREAAREYERIVADAVHSRLHDELAASQAREQALREEVERLRQERDEARQEAEDAVTLLDQHLEHHPWSTVPLLWLRGEQELHCSDDAPDHDEQEKDGEGCG